MTDKEKLDTLCKKMGVQPDYLSFNPTMFNNQSCLVALNLGAASTKP